MATWTDVSSTVLEPGDPIRSVDIIAIKENVIALSEGASGAPKIQAAALNTGTNERDWVLARYAAADFGAVGTYAVLMPTATSNLAIGGTVAGSALRSGAAQTGTGANLTLGMAGQRTQAGTGGYSGGGTAMSGTWRKVSNGLSYSSGLDEYGSVTSRTFWNTLYVRIS
jgi:hypothetical protein